MPGRKVSLEELVGIIAARGRGGRHVTAIAGPPGAGKSTLAEALEKKLNAAEPGAAAILPMDGYHFDDRVLVPRGWRPRKGAPHTFDVGGFAAMVERLVANREDEVAVPVFDRDLEIARAGARLIPRSVRHLLVEGNYLLLKAGPWAGLRPLFGTTVFIDVPYAVLEERLLARWHHYQLSPEELVVKMEGNDLPNVRLVLAESIEPEFRLGEETG